MDNDIVQQAQDVLDKIQQQCDDAAQANEQMQQPEGPMAAVGFMPTGGTAAIAGIQSILASLLALAQAVYNTAQLVSDLNGAQQSSTTQQQ